MITGSLTTCDPGDISTTIATCKSLNIRCSVIALSAEVMHDKYIAGFGSFSVCKFERKTYFKTIKVLVS